MAVQRSVDFFFRKVINSSELRVFIEDGFETLGSEPFSYDR